MDVRIPGSPVFFTCVQEEHRNVPEGMDLKNEKGNGFLFWGKTIAFDCYSCICFSSFGFKEASAS